MREIVSFTFETMRDLGGKDTYLIREGEIWRLVLPAILHGGILHIFMNLAFQTYLCYTYERLWGTGRIAYFYFLTAIGASIMSAVCSPQSVSVGASGSLFGMLGCQMVPEWKSDKNSKSPNTRGNRKSQNRKNPKSLVQGKL